MRKFARQRFTEEAPKAHDENDYAGMIEEDMKNLSFSDTEEEIYKLPDTIGKIRHAGS